MQTNKQIFHYRLKVDCNEVQGAGKNKANDGRNVKPKTDKKKQSKIGSQSLLILENS